MCSHDCLYMQTHVMQRSSTEQYDVQHEIRTSRGSRNIHIHPLVTFNVADHYTRFCRQHSPAVAASKTTHVIGALFGIQKGLEVSILDSFELKYEVSDRKEVQIDKDFLSGRLNQCEFFYAIGLIRNDHNDQFKSHRYFPTMSFWGGTLLGRTNLRWISRFTRRFVWRSTFVRSSQQI